MYIRNCPTCNEELHYINKHPFYTAIKRNSNCKSCASKLRITDEDRLNRSKRMSGKNNPGYGKTGKSNAFYGKTHTPETIDILRNIDKSYTKTEDFKNKCKKPGKLNGMYGKSFYDVWVEKYGLVIANEKLKAFKETQSLNSKGKKNSMYGKPSPIGSGNGWSGWYKDWYFRSILELSYMINIIERFNITWERAENSKYKVNYSINGSERTYVADFILSEKYMIEIKPKKLHNSVLVMTKQTAAIEFCKLHNLTYKITYCSKLSDEEICKLIDSNQVKLIPRYQKKYEKRYKK